MTNQISLIRKINQYDMMIVLYKQVSQLVQGLISWYIPSIIILNHRRDLFHSSFPLSLTFGRQGTGATSSRATQTRQPTARSWRCRPPSLAPNGVVVSRSARSPSSLGAIGKKNTRDPVLVKSQRVNEINETTIGKLVYQYATYLLPWYPGFQAGAARIGSITASRTQASSQTLGVASH